MSQPDLLSARIDELRTWLMSYKRGGVRIEPEALIAFDALLGDFVDEARTLEARAAQRLPLDRVIADLDEETRATNAMAASLARTKERIVEMRASQDAPPKCDAQTKAVLAGVEAGKVALFPIIPRPVFGEPRNGDMPVEDALDCIAALTRDAPKSRFSDAPTFDTPEDCA